MYEEITDVSPYEQPMQIFPAVHYTMGGIWVDYNLMTTIPGLYAIGEANFSDHGANRLGASALMQGLADGYFVLPYTIGDYLSHKIPGSEGEDRPTKAFDEAEKGVREKIAKLLVDQRQAVGGRHPQEAGPHHVGERRHGPHEESPSKRPSPRFRRCARSSGRT